MVIQKNALLHHNGEYGLFIMELGTRVVENKKQEDKNLLKNLFGHGNFGSI